MHHRGPPGPRGRPALLAIAALAALLAALHLRHASRLPDAVGWLVVAVHLLLPLGLALALPWLGLAVLRATEEPEHPVVLGWIGVSTVVSGAVAGWALLHVVHHGGAVSEVSTLLANGATFGAVAGLLVGSYDAQRRASARRARDQSRRTEEVAEIVSHDLRNTLNLSQGYVDLAVETGDLDRLAHARRAHDRMETVIDELLMLVEDRPPRARTVEVAVARAVRDAWAAAGEPGELVVDVAATVTADPARLRELFEHVFRTADAHVDGSLSVGVRPIDGGVAVAFDESVPVDVVETSAPREGGFELYLVSSIAEAHGWGVDVRVEDGGTVLELRWRSGADADESGLLDSL